jgi:hypothetical protein
MLVRVIDHLEPVDGGHHAARGVTPTADAARWDAGQPGGPVPPPGIPVQVAA